MKFPLAAIATALVLGMPPSAEAQLPADPFSYSRSSSFAYYPNGLIKTETIEPENIASCQITTYTYDTFGNKSGLTVSNCAGSVPVAQQFVSRSTSISYLNPPLVTIEGKNVWVPPGAFGAWTTNALGHSDVRQFDPRFGVMISLNGPNSLTTFWTLDDLGRPVRETRADGGSVITFYCYLASAGVDTSSNSVGCPTPPAAEIPVGASMFMHTEQRHSEVKSGPFTRTYSDRQGRPIRTVAEGFDGATQPSHGVVVQDTEYNPYGAGISLTTEPYFLATGSSVTTGSANAGMSATNYDVLGRPKFSYKTDQQGSQTIAFGSRGTRRAAVNTWTYNGLTTIITDDFSKPRTEEKNINGQVVRVTDALGAQLAHQYDAFGNLLATRDALKNSIELKYDIRGRKVSILDPDTGLTQFDYDPLGQLVWQQNPKQKAVGTATTHFYDALGRLIRRAAPEYSGIWTYDKYADGSVCNKGIGKLCETSTSHGIRRRMVYDSLGRSVNIRTDVTAGPSFAGALSYDSFGRVATKTYPTGLKVKYGYTPKGFVDTLRLATPATLDALPTIAGDTPPASVSLPADSLLWQAQVYNAWGKLERHKYGNDIVNRADFLPTGEISMSSAGAGTATNVLNYTYAWDGLGRLLAKSDANGDGLTGAVTDTYKYDDLGRLNNYAVAAPSIPNLQRSVDLQYNALGQLLYKSDVGIYAYRPSGPGATLPHGLENVTGNIGSTGKASYSYDVNGNLTSVTDGRYQSIAYTSFNLPDSQTGLLGTGVSGNASRYLWQYDENYQRMKEVRVITGGEQAGTRTTWILHPDNTGGLSFESEVNAPTIPSASNPAGTSNRHYLVAGGINLGVLVTKGALPVLSSTQTEPPVLSSATLVKQEYWHKDHLGSLVATTDRAGNVTARYAYDPFGKRRFTKGTYDTSGLLVVDWSNAVNHGTDRGYTGHEHLDDVGLVHMNGRIFDPTLGIFLQADPLIQGTDNLQNYNRYGYCFNNPLTCTDPSGHDFWSKAGHLQDRIVTSGFFGTPEVAYGIWRVLNSDKYGYQVKSIATGIGAVFCGPWVVICNAGGQAALAKSYGADTDAAMEAGVLAGLTTAVFNMIGGIVPGYGQVGIGGAPATGETIFANTVFHAAAGCVISSAEGGTCRAGALSAGLSALAGRYYSDELLIGTMQAAVVGGVGAVLAGEKFGGGAVMGAFGYLYNHAQHTDTFAKLSPAQAKELGESFMENKLQRPGFDVHRNVTAYVGDLRIELDRVFYNQNTKELWTAEAKLGPNSSFTQNQRNPQVIKALNTGDFRVVNVAGIDPSLPVSGQVRYNLHHIVTINATRIMRSPVYKNFISQGTQTVKFWWRFGGEQ